MKFLAHTLYCTLSLEFVSMAIRLPYHNKASLTSEPVMKKVMKNLPNMVTQ